MVENSEFSPQSTLNEILEESLYGHRRSTYKNRSILRENCR